MLRHAQCDASLFLFNLKQPPQESGYPRSRDAHRMQMRVLQNTLTEIRKGTNTEIAKTEITPCISFSAHLEAIVSRDQADAKQINAATAAQSCPCHLCVSPSLVAQWSMKKRCRYIVAKRCHTGVQLTHWQQTEIPYSFASLAPKLHFCRENSQNTRIRLLQMRGQTIFFEG